MALIVITLADNQESGIDIGIQAEPTLGQEMIIPASAMTPAQRMAIKMLNVAQREVEKKEQPLIQLN